MSQRTTSSPSASQTIAQDLTRASHDAFLKELESSARVAALLLDALTLCHHLQAERGASFLNLAFPLEREPCPIARFRVSTDAAREAVEQESAKWITDGAVVPPWAGRCLGKALEVLGDLAEWRRRIDVREAAAAEVFDWFSRVVDCLIEVISGANGVRFPGILRMLATLTCLAEAKESAGRERAMIAHAIANGRLDGQGCSELGSHLLKQDSLLGAASAFLVSIEHPLSLGDIDPLTAPLEKTRRQAMTGRLVGGVSPEDWFQLASTRMDWLWELERSVATRIAGELSSMMQDVCRSESPPVAISRLSSARSSVVVFPTGGLCDPRLPAVQPGFVGPLAESLLESSRCLQQLRSELAAARTELDERKQVERAKRLLMKHHGLDEEKAYRTLRSRAMSRSIKISDLAAMLISTEPLWATDSTPLTDQE